MHGVLLGVIKILTELRFDVAHRGHKWSIHFSQVKYVGEKLMTIRPPNAITRLPQSIQTNIKWWKVAVYRSFLLFYTVPCLYRISPKYFAHLVLLIIFNAHFIKQLNQPTRVETSTEDVEIVCFAN